MPHFDTTRTVRHMPQDMFDLVADVEQYPEFLPLCIGLTVRSRKMDEAGREVLVANMSVGYKAIRERFTSRVTLDREALQILVEYIDGPFSHLENRWTFEPNDAAGRTTRVVFSIDYEFRQRMLGAIMGAVFDKAFRRFAEAFERRADAVYGRGTQAQAEVG